MRPPLFSRNLVNQHILLKPQPAFPQVSQSERHEYPSVGFSALTGPVLFSFEMRRYL